MAQEVVVSTLSSASDQEEGSFERGRVFLVD